MYKIRVNGKFSDNKENILFSSRVILASEIFLNLITALMFFLINNENKITEIGKNGFALIFAICLLTPLYFILFIIKRKNIYRFLEENDSLKSISTIVGVLYTIITFVLFFSVAPNARKLIAQMLEL